MSSSQSETVEWKTTEVGITIGSLYICRFDESHYWIQKTDGEGMSVKTADLEKLLLEYFEENF